MYFLNTGTFKCRIFLFEPKKLKDNVKTQKLPKSPTNMFF
ncbi:hypothetical protein C943_00293 [Mariniradius saccharolyticus AK6]|uniref:Uncharacterized protein n=1 Tax=Mariniradius saccharolyticus AK6 TaxID=1239962 RepID=M7Y716_9BACT|nr:hypothetical protein C943_00293 [Mariniradius saccharolyticus AK6]